ncbi:MAG: hypothetical protein ACREQ5_06130, partial [Candidatus Dormibacteria bacterium]
NAFDFNFTQVLGIDGTSSNGTFFTFLCPLGYRAVPRKWHIFFDSAPGGTAANTTGTLLNNNVAVPSNTNIILGGTGTGDTPLESFFVVEENTLFGIQIVLTGIVGIFSTNVLVYGNLLPVTNVALPFEVTNAIR